MRTLVTVSRATSVRPEPSLNPRRAVFSPGKRRHTSQLRRRPLRIPSDAEYATRCRRLEAPSALPAVAPWEILMCLSQEPGPCSQEPFKSKFQRDRRQQSLKKRLGHCLRPNLSENLSLKNRILPGRRCPRKREKPLRGWSTNISRYFIKCYRRIRLPGRSMTGASNN